MLSNHDINQIKKYRAENADLDYLFNAIEKEYKTTLSYISHELRNTLTLIISSMQYMETAYPESKEFKYWLETTQDLYYMKSLLIGLSDYTKGNLINSQQVDFKALVEHVYRSCHGWMNEDTHFNLLSCHENCIIIGDPVKLQQALTNIIKNSYEALDGKGSVLIQLSIDGPTICLKVTDSGVGMTDEQMQKIGTPFTTYKKDGTGLGLAITQRIIEAHHGSLHINSIPGKGTTITIYLPNSSSGI